MPKRDLNGRFMKSDGDGVTISFTLPTFSRIIIWGIILLVLSPWIFILERFKIWNTIISKFEWLFAFKDGENGAAKKNGLFS